MYIGHFSLSDIDMTSVAERELLFAKMVRIKNKEMKEIEQVKDQTLSYYDIPDFDK